MKKLLILSAIILLGGAFSANAQTSWPITVYTGSAAVHTTPLATLQVTRTPLASGSWDSLEIKLTNWLIPAYQTADGGHGVGAEINVLTGTFSAVGGASPGISLDSGEYWAGLTTWNFPAHTPTAPAPASYVNLEGTAGTFTRTGTSPNYASVYGGWYASNSYPATLAKTDYNLGDGKDQTVIAKFFVTAGTDLNFVADPLNPEPGHYNVDGVATTTEGLAYWSFSTAQVPEPGTIALLVSGLMGLLCYAWRKRK